MARLERTDPRTSHLLFTSNPKIPPPIETRRLPRLCSISLVGLCYRRGQPRVLAHSCPGRFRVSRSTSSSPKGTLRWAREVIGPEERQARRINKALLPRQKKRVCVTCQR